MRRNRKSVLVGVTMAIIVGIGLCSLNTQANGNGSQAVPPEHQKMGALIGCGSQLPDKSGVYVMTSGYVTADRKHPGAFKVSDAFELLINPISPETAMFALYESLRVELEAILLHKGTYEPGTIAFHGPLVDTTGSFEIGQASVFTRNECAKLQFVLYRTPLYIKTLQENSRTLIIRPRTHPTT